MATIITNNCCKKEGWGSRKYIVLPYFRSGLKFQLIHEVLVTKSIKQLIHSRSDFQIEIKILGGCGGGVGGLSSNLFCIIYHIHTVVGITCRGKYCHCGTYMQFIIIDIDIGHILFCGRGG